MVTDAVSHICIFHICRINAVRHLPSFQIILDLFSPHAKKRPYIHPIYRIYTAESPKSATAGQMQEKCLCIVILGDVPVRSLFLPILPLPAQIFPFVQSFPPLLLTSCIPLPFSEYPPKHSCMGFLFSSHSVFTNSSSAFASSPRIP